MNCTDTAAVLLAAAMADIVELRDLAHSYRVSIPRIEGEIKVATEKLVRARAGLKHIQIALLRAEARLGTLKHAQIVGEAVNFTRLPNPSTLEQQSETTLQSTSSPSPKPTE